MKNELPFNLRRFKEAYYLVENSQNKFIELVIKSILEFSTLRCPAPANSAHPSGQGFCFVFFTKINVCEIPVKVHIYSDRAEGNGDLLLLKITCNDLFIKNRTLYIPKPVEFAIHWTDESVKTPNFVKKLIVKN